MSRKFFLIIVIDVFLMASIGYCLATGASEVISGLLTALVSITGLYFGGNVGEHYVNKGKK